MIVDKGPVKQYVTFLRNGLVGVDAKTGKFLWMYNKTIDQGANILTPIVVGDRVFSAGSRTGGGLVQLKADGDGVTADQIYFARKVAPSIGGAVLLDGNLYGTSQQTMFCADFDTGEVKWTDRAVGPASLCYADRRLYVRGHSSGDVVLVEPSSRRLQGKRPLQTTRSQQDASLAAPGRCQRRSLSPRSGRALVLRRRGQVNCPPGKQMAGGGIRGGQRLRQERSPRSLSPGIADEPARLRSHDSARAGRGCRHDPCRSRWAAGACRERHSHYLAVRVIRSLPTWSDTNRQSAHGNRTGRPVLLAFGRQ